VPLKHEFKNAFFFIILNSIRSGKIVIVNFFRARVAPLVEKLLWQVVPLDTRKGLALLAGKLGWLPACHSITIPLVRDWASKDADAFHRFLWSHHIGYARDYEGVHDFGAENLRPTRKLLFEALRECLLLQGRDALERVETVFEVGCSGGYLLRFMETELFPSAVTLEGVDIDRQAIENGKTYLRAHSSKVRLINADTADLERVMDGRKYDVIVCAGVLMYHTERAAASIVRLMLNHCKGLVAISGPAHAIFDNAELEHSDPRRSDGAFIHNFDSMVQNAGGSIVYRRWEGARTFDGNTVYFVFCRPKE
jgi:2-polyprenyl-3-methyl-5-hydroxy-6-metoxy-1,4-benzoquinol methylase